MVNVTVPVGVLWDAGAVTTAVKVTAGPRSTDWPTTTRPSASDTSAADPTAFENAEVFPDGSVAVAV